MDKEFDLIVIGSGPGGYVAAIRAAQLGLKVACVEKRSSLGGTCLNVGCIPSKTLLHTSELFAKIQNEGHDLGIDGSSLSYDWTQMLKRKDKVIASLNQGINGLFKKNSVTAIYGMAHFTSPHTVAVSDEDKTDELKAKSFIIATGSEPSSLPFLPLNEKTIISSTGALSLDSVPKRLLVVGAGVIGVEMGSVFQRLGSEVTFIEYMDRICPQFDPALSSALEKALKKQGMKFRLSTKVTKAETDPSLALTVEDQEGKEQTLDADVILVAVGRKPFTEGLCLEKAGLAVNERGQIPVDANFVTAQPHIRAIGDVIDGPMLAHKASEEGFLVAELIAGHSYSLNYLTIPNVIYTYPEVASVGFTEQELKERSISYKVGNYPFAGNSRAKCTGEEEGFVKVLADSESGKVLGVHMIGPHASELIAEGALSLGRSSEEVGHQCFAHPTLSESFKESLLSLHKKAIHK